MALTDTLRRSRWLSALHFTRGVVLTLRTAVHVVRPCVYAVTTVYAPRSTTPTLSALSGRSVCPHHILTLSFSFSLIVAAPPVLWLPQEGLVLPTCHHVVAPPRYVARLDVSVPPLPPPLPHTPPSSHCSAYTPHPAFSFSLSLCSPLRPSLTPHGRSTALGSR